jgi:hypothetical protein
VSSTVHFISIVLMPDNPQMRRFHRTNSLSLAVACMKIALGLASIFSASISFAQERLTFAEKSNNKYICPTGSYLYEGDYSMEGSYSLFGGSNSWPFSLAYALRTGRINRLDGSSSSLDSIGLKLSSTVFAVKLAKRPISGTESDIIRKELENKDFTSAGQYKLVDYSEGRVDSTRGLKLSYENSQKRRITLLLSSEIGNSIVIDNTGKSFKARLDQSRLQVVCGPSGPMRTRFVQALSIYDQETQSASVSPSLFVVTEISVNPQQQVKSDAPTF